MLFAALTAIFSVEVFVEGSYGVNLSSSAYNSENPFKNYPGECTWYAWGRTYEKSKIALSWRTADNRLGNAKEWLECAKNYGYQWGNEPKEGAIIVWTGDEYGHVAIIEAISGNTLYI